MIQEFENRDVTIKLGTILGHLRGCADTLRTVSSELCSFTSPPKYFPWRLIWTQGEQNDEFSTGLHRSGKIKGIGIGEKNREISFSSGLTFTIRKHKYQTGRWIFKEEKEGFSLKINYDWWRQDGDGEPKEENLEWLYDSRQENEGLTWLLPLWEKAKASSERFARFEKLNQKRVKTGMEPFPLEDLISGV